MNLKININFLEEYLAYLINDNEYKWITKNLEEYDLMADVDDQRFHHFRSTVNLKKIKSSSFFFFPSIFSSL